jgi:hypothetical protein
MSSKKDELLEVEILSKKLLAIYSEWDKKRPKSKPKYDAESFVRLTMALAITSNPERRKEIEKKLEALKPKEDVINISLSPRELLFILKGLNIEEQFYHTEQYVKESIGTGVSNEQRWSKVAEMMLIKEVGGKLKLHDDDAFCFYWAHIKRGLKPRQASEEVFKEFKFISQEACDQWLKRKVNEMKKKHPIYAEIPAPSTSHRLK